VEAENVPSLFGKRFQGVRENLTDANRKTVKKTDRSPACSEPADVTINATSRSFRVADTTERGGSLLTCGKVLYSGI
jgi:hypothetical protein